MPETSIVWFDWDLRWYNPLKNFFYFFIGGNTGTGMGSRVFLFIIEIYDLAWLALSKFLSKLMEAGSYKGSGAVLFISNWLLEEALYLNSLNFVYFVIPLYSFNLYIFFPDNFLGGFYFVVLDSPFFYINFTPYDILSSFYNIYIILYGLFLSKAGAFLF